MVTSSTRKRWIIPKGNVEPQLGPLESARREAFEEAGIRGRVHHLCFGSYRHRSTGGDTLVEVYLMEVSETLERWPEQHSRIREWMPLPHAYDRVLENGLRLMLRELHELLT